MTTQRTESAQIPPPRLLSNPVILWATAGLSGSVFPRSAGPALALALLFLFLFLFFRSKGARLVPFALCVCVFFGSAFRSDRSVLSYAQKYQETAELLSGPKRCALQGEVVTSPTLRSGAEPTEADTLLFTVHTSHLDCEGVIFQEPLLVRLYSADQPLGRGDTISAVASLAPVQLFRNAPLTDPVPGAARRGALLSGAALALEREGVGADFSSVIDRLRGRVRQRIIATYRPEVESLGRALVLGENDLPESDAEAFQHSGLLHLLAVSGTHLVIAVLSLVGGMTALLTRVGPLARRFDTPRLASALGAVLSVLYADFSGGSGSAWRAAFMLVVVLAGRSAGFRVDGVTALGASVLIGLVLDPLAASDYSFMLSALATIGLIALGAPVARSLTRRMPESLVVVPIASSLLATVASTLPCAPVLALMNGEMTLAALIANVVAGPLGELIALPACLLHALVPDHPRVEQGLATLGSGALLGVRAIALLSASVEAAQFQLPYPTPTRLALVSVALLTAVTLLLRLPRTGPKFRVLAPLALLAALPVAAPACGTSPENRVLSVTALDVGQGDALFVEFPDGRVGLVDGGGYATGIPDTGLRVLRPFLRARGIDRLDLVVLSHAHPDHINGLLSLLPLVEVGQLWIPHLPDQPKGSLARLVDIARKQGATIQTASELCAQSRTSPLRFGGAKLEVLAPCAPVSPPLSLNDDSLVFRLGFEKRRFLFTGDVEERGESLLIESERERLRADVLKVAHHGSDTSSGLAFLAAVQPKMAVISCGIRNRFDHPRRSTLDALAQSNVVVHRTDRQGSVTFRTDGQFLEVRDSGTFPAWPNERRGASSPHEPR